ncbi:MAG: galactose-1-phosphate uridylyltransferase [Actinomycetota bacterium]
MPELRQDALTGAQVIVAPNRAQRPNAVERDGAERLLERSETCPFCPGNEAMTPPEVARVDAGASDPSGWSVRVFPNLYPIVGGNIDGVHEVAVFSPAHNRSYGALDKTARHTVWRVLRDRAAQHLSTGCAHVAVFFNQGQRAGASLEHPHAQIVGLPFVPPLVVGISARFASTDLVAQSIADAREHGLIVRDGAVVTWCPLAAPSPFLVRCALPDGDARFDQTDHADVDAVADAVFDTVNRHAAVLGTAPYNVVVHSGPAPGAFHWWVDVVPRISTLAGFEFSTGLFVNIYDPAMVATWLREPS